MRNRGKEITFRSEKARGVWKRWNKKGAILDDVVAPVRVQEAFNRYLNP